MKILREPTEQLEKYIGLCNKCGTIAEDYESGIHEYFSNLLTIKGVYSVKCPKCLIEQQMHFYKESTPEGKKILALINQ